MTYDFKSRLLKGSESAVLADRNNARINAVLEELGQQIFDATDGEVVICTTVLYDIGGQVTRHLEADGDSAPSFEAIVARPGDWDEGDDENREFILAELVRGTVGFPCTIVFDGYEFQCDDAAGLTGALGELMALTSTGKIINHLREPGRLDFGHSRRPL